jgi:hypothetical protein
MDAPNAEHLPQPLSLRWVKRVDRDRIECHHCVLQQAFGSLEDGKWAVLWKDVPEVDEAEGSAHQDGVA